MANILMASQVAIILTPQNFSDDLACRVIVLSPETRNVFLGRASKNENKGLFPEKGNGWFNNPVMSRTHALLSLSPEAGVVTLEDLESMHGTMINDRSIKPKSEHKIQSGDTLTFGCEVARGPDIFRPRSYTVNLRYNSDLDIPQKRTSNRYGISKIELEMSDDEAPEEIPIEFGVKKLSASPGGCTISMPYSDDSASDDSDILREDSPYPANCNGIWPAGSPPAQSPPEPSLAPPHLKSAPKVEKKVTDLTSETGTSANPVDLADYPSLSCHHNVDEAIPTQLSSQDEDNIEGTSVSTKSDYACSLNSGNGDDGGSLVYNIFPTRDTRSNPSLLEAEYDEFSLRESTEEASEGEDAKSSVDFDEISSEFRTELEASKLAVMTEAAELARKLKEPPSISEETAPNNHHPNVATENETALRPAQCGALTPARIPQDISASSFLPQAISQGRAPSPSDAAMAKIATLNRAELTFSSQEIWFDELQNSTTAKASADIYQTREAQPIACGEKGEFFESWQQNRRQFPPTICTPGSSHGYLSFRGDPSPPEQTNSLLNSAATIKSMDCDFGQSTSTGNNNALSGSGAHWASVVSNSRLNSQTQPVTPLFAPDIKNHLDTVGVDCSLTNPLNYTKQRSSQQKRISKSRLEIRDIVEPLPHSPALPLKRSIDKISSITPGEHENRHPRCQQILEKKADEGNVQPSPRPNDITLKTWAEYINAEAEAMKALKLPETDEPARKKIKTKCTSNLGISSLVSTALTGVLVGGAAIFAILVAIPLPPAA
ncbi:MAG: hypothetical protein M1829_002265 [Trizodia sp. TS-e1964]|nr:MAG: hypothetical protein M1829_002265 [Trizodia sp. TS-e1964]